MTVWTNYETKIFETTFKKNRKLHQQSNIRKQNEFDTQQSWIRSFENDIYETEFNDVSKIQTEKKTKKNAYYSCDKKNHFAKNCKSKNVVRRQFNVTLKKKFKTQKKKWKNINYETIKISSTDFKNEKFHKIDESQDF